MGSTRKTIVIIAVVICGWFAPLMTGSFDVEENWKRCRARADDDPSNRTQLQFCGYELGEG